MANVTPLRLGIALAAALLLVLTLFPLAYAEGGVGVISGKVQNRTAGGSAVGGLEVSLHTFAHQTEGAPLTTTTDKDGNFKFEGLSTEPTVAYGVGVQFKDIGYGTDFLVFEQGKSSVTADVSVFDTETNPSVMSIERGHIILSDFVVDTQTMSVMEILILNNKSDRVFISGTDDPATLKITLPEGATDLQTDPDMAQAVKEITNGFAFEQPLLPGRSQLMYVYQWRYPGGSFDFSRSFQYPAQQLSVLAPETGIKVSSGQLTPQPSVELGAQGKYQHVSGANIAGDTKVTVRLEGVPTPSPFAFLSNLPRWTWPAAGGTVLVLIAGTVFVILRRRARADAEEDFVDEEFDEDDESLSFEDEEPEEDRAAEVTLEKNPRHVP